jgi:hypothetical protein
VYASRRVGLRVGERLVTAGGPPARPGRGCPIPQCGENASMTVFYWTMAVLIVGTFAPAAMYLILYAVTGEHACLSRGRLLWNLSRVFTLAAINLLIWGHVVVGLWQIGSG